MTHTLKRHVDFIQGELDNPQAQSAEDRLWKIKQLLRDLQQEAHTDPRPSDTRCGDAAAGFERIMVFVGRPTKDLFRDLRFFWFDLMVSSFTPDHIARLAQRLIEKYSPDRPVQGVINAHPSSWDFARVLAVIRSATDLRSYMESYQVAAPPASVRAHAQPEDTSPHAKLGKSIKEAADALAAAEADFQIRSDARLTLGADRKRKQRLMEDAQQAFVRTHHAFAASRAEFDKAIDARNEAKRSLQTLESERERVTLEDRIAENAAKRFKPNY